MIKASAAARSLTILLAALFWGQVAGAEKRHLTIDDVLSLEFLERVSPSPDGSMVAAVIRRGVQPGEIYGRVEYEVDPSRDDIWLIDRATGTKRNLTQGKHLAAGAWCATWSPDGRYLAFLSTRPERGEPRGGDNVRLYYWDRRSGAIRRLSDKGVMTQTRYGAGIHRLDVAGPSRPVPDACLQGDENPPFAWVSSQRLLVASPKAGQTSGLMDVHARMDRMIDSTRRNLQAGQVASLSISGSGKERTFASNEEQADLDLVNVRTGKWTNVATVPAYPFDGSLGVRVAPDGKRAAILATIAAFAPQSGSSFPSLDGEWLVEKRLGLVKLQPSSTVEWIELPSEAKLPLALHGWEPDGKGIAFSARATADQKEENYYRVDAGTRKVTSRSKPTAPADNSPPLALPDGAELLAHDRRGVLWKEATPSGVFVRSATRDTKNIVTLLTLDNHLSHVEMGRVLKFDYKTRSGNTLHGTVLLPPDHVQGRKIPVITWVYGGATNPGADTFFLDPYQPGIYNLRLYAGQGYAVLLPSIPLKRDGTEDHITRITDSVVPAVDKLVALGIADPTRIGVLGQSYGGYSALALATQTDRFSAVVAVAPISDLTAYFGDFDPTARGFSGIEHEKSANPPISEIGAAALQGPPYEQADRYRRNSPLSFVDRVRAPVLLLHGERDTRGTLYQSESFFMGLWRQGKTAKIVRYWGEGHAIANSPATVRSAFGEILSWFDKYLPPAT